MDAVVDVDHVLASSLTLSERVALVGSQKESSHAPLAERVVESRLRAWNERLRADDGRQLLVQRLRRDGIPLSVAARACAPDLRHEGPNPEWLVWFLAGVQALADGHIDSAARSTGVAFADLLSTFVRSATARLKGLEGAQLWAGLPSRAKESAVRQLLKRLSNCLQWCLYSRFDEFRREATTDRGIYDEFVNMAAREEWAAHFFNTFAGMARPVGAILISWSDNTVRLLSRWDKDREAVLRFVGAPTDARVADFEAFPSDAHANGQTVVIIRLTSGHRVVYKPTEPLLADFWQSATELCFGASPPQPEALLGSGYGWHRHVSASSDHLAGGGAALGEHCEQLGSLLALATALGATDLHYENFIYAVGGPALVDHETVLSPGIRLTCFGETSAQRKALGVVARSVLSTGSLPQWLSGPDGAMWQVDLFGWRDQRVDAEVFPFLLDTNTDNMRVCRSRGLRPPDAGQSVSRAAPGDASSFERIVSGFRDGWSQVLAARSTLIDLAQTLQGGQARVILRDTRFYAELLGQSLMPRFGHDLIDRSLLLERLCAPLLTLPDDDPRWRLYNQEHDALIRCDIPAFVTPASSLLVREVGSGGTPVRLIGSSPLARALNSLKSLRPGAGDLNGELIRSAFEASAWPVVTVRQAGVGCCRGSSRLDGWRTRLECADTLLNHVRRNTYSSRSDNSIALLAASLASNGKGQTLGVSDLADTYSGIAGLGLLAGLLNVVRPSAKYRGLATKIADSLAMSAETSANVGNADRCGAFCGSAGLAFVLRGLGDLLEQECYSTVARATLITWADRAREPNQELDVISGAAGVCLVGALLVPTDVKTDPRVFEVVTSHAAVLRERACQSDSLGTCHWQLMGEESGVSGFAHGVAGVGAAMARLHQLGIGDYSQYVVGALNYELARYDRSASGWPVTRVHGHHDETAGNGWCYGGPGMLLAALEAITAGVAVPQRFLGLAVDTSRRMFTTADGLCHGNAGTSAILCRFGSQSGDQQLIDEGRSRLFGIAERFLSGGGLGVEPTSSLIHSAGLMCGTTGIGLAVISPEAANAAGGLLAVSGLVNY